MIKWVLISYGITVAAGLAYTKILMIEKENLELKLETIQTAYADQSDTIQSLSQLNDKLVDNHEAAVAAERAIYEQTQRVTAELNKLRYTESQRALDAPFERGDAAHNRRYAAVMRFTQNNGGSAQSTGDPEAGFAQPASAPGNRDPTADSRNR